MAQQAFFYDRVDLYLNGDAYLPDGQIRNFRIEGRYNTKLVQGFTKDGTASGFVIGNIAVTMDWTEFMPTQSEYLNWRTYLIANPNSTLTIVPRTLAQNVAIGPSFVIVGLQSTLQTNAAPGEGEVMTRDCSFVAKTSSNL